MMAVSLFVGVNPIPCQVWPLVNVLASIRNGMHKHAVNACRDALILENRAAYTQLKKTLPSFTPAGVFGPTRSNANFQDHSGIAHFDIDHLDNPEAAKETLLCVRGTWLAYCFTSPSGTGLKVGFNIGLVADDRAYKHAWGYVATQLTQHEGLVIDQSGKDVARLCFVSHDPAMYINLTAQVIDVPPMPTDMVTPPPPRTEERPPLDRVRRYVHTAIRNAETILDRSGDGTRHACRLRAGRLLGGYCTPEFRLSQAEALALIEAAVLRNTTTPAKAMRTMQAAIAYGSEQPVALAQLEAERLEWKGARV